MPTRQIAEAISRRLNLSAMSLPDADAAEHFEFLKHILALDIHASSAATRDLLNWQPVQAGLIADIEQSPYGED